ncbi:GNAT family N-acetyltransferase [Silvimonas sp.]|uniref:GNAT family N-acetyltransferase n=1 Tax=Silvimonas sp. TaxID=2650811 RepID=UPI0028504674|nr:GNAT family N-acetyltransferase [Silvimonas sp.]MDR3427275.1 GNAT family N-acetyltransferase [Silvimonas sp.]
MTTQIALLEGITQSAWPAISTELFDGWLLRFADGYTKRANSVTPLYEGVLAEPEKLAYCEQRFAAAGLPSIFKLTAQNAVLDATLAERGYEQIDISSVQIADLREVDCRVDQAVTLWRQPEVVWMDAFTHINGLTAAQRAIAERMLALYAAPTTFAALVENGQIVACGFAVRQHVYMLMFDICTDPAQRGQGYGRRLVASLLAWGIETGATHGLLQVVAANAAAVKLYAGFGYVEQYRYWYRQRAARA